MSKSLLALIVAGLIGSSAFMLAEPDIEVRPMELIQRFDDGSREEIYELLALRNVLLRCEGLTPATSAITCNERSLRRFSSM